MKKLLTVLIFSSVMSSCQTTQPQAAESLPAGVHKFVLEDVIVTANYQYLQAKENDSTIWLAIPQMQVTKGETYYYKNPMKMENFSSKELNRTFDVVYFLEGISKDTSGVFLPRIGESTANVQTTNNAEAPAAEMPQADTTGKRSLNEPHASPGAQVTEKTTVKVDKAPGGITIGELFAKKDTYAGKTVKVKGKVIKVNPSIMKRNWLHIQDGTSSGEKYDLTVTTEGEFNVGDVVILEGKITLNKDFGFGYFYDVLMEDAVQK